LQETKRNNESIKRVVGGLALCGGGWHKTGWLRLDSSVQFSWVELTTVQDGIGQEHITHTLRLIIGYLSADKRKQQQQWQREGEREWGGAQRGTGWGYVCVCVCVCVCVVSAVSATLNIEKCKFTNT